MSFWDLDSHSNIYKISENTIFGYLAILQIQFNSLFY